jgi:hypothetical protein
MSATVTLSQAQVSDYAAEAAQIVSIVRKCLGDEAAARYVATCLRVEYYRGKGDGSREAFELSRAVLSGEKG